MEYPPNCLFCKNYLSPGKCKAFSSQIPDFIWFELKEHDKPIDGQGNNIVFEPITEFERINNGNQEQV